MDEESKFGEKMMKKRLLALVKSTIAATSLIGEPQAIVFDFGGVLTKCKIV